MAACSLFDPPILSVVCGYPSEAIVRRVLGSAGDAYETSNNPYVISRSPGRPAVV